MSSVASCLRNPRPRPHSTWRLSSRQLRGFPCQHPDLHAPSSQRQLLSHNHVAFTLLHNARHGLFDWHLRFWMVACERASVSSWHHRPQCHLDPCVFGRFFVSLLRFVLRLSLVSSTSALMSESLLAPHRTVHKHSVTLVG